ncbi:MAG: RecX family transcriptional regulator [Candidatus Saccharimonadales bacterium]
MKITVIKKQARNPQRVSVFVDGKYSFSLSLDELVKYKVKKNDELSEAEVKKFKKLSADGKLRQRALEWLLTRPHSTRELKDYLYRKKVEPEHAQKLIEEFGDREYLDDRRYAKWLVDLRARKGKSNRAIAAELFKKGVSREIVDEVLEKSEGESDRLNALVEKKSKLSRYANKPLKLVKYLTSQGFDYQMVKESLAKHYKDF